MVDKYSAADSYTDPDTGVLINKLGLLTQDELDEAEAALVSVAIAELVFEPLMEGEGGPGLDFLCDIHRKLFGDLYEWAGEFRTVDISKGSTRFANVRFIEAEGERLMNSLASENWLCGLPHDEFADRAAFYMGELNTLHPFREGNGRALREYIRHIAARAGHSLSWEGLDRDEMTEAAISAYKLDHQKMRGVLLKQMTCC